MRNRNGRSNATLICGAIAALTAFSGSSALAAPLDISDTPLFLTSGVQPNLLMAIDDSGSMDYEVLFPANDGLAWWRANAASGNCPAATGQSFVGCIADGTTDQPAAGRLNFNNSGNGSTTWRRYGHLFPNGCNYNDDSFQRRLCDGDEWFALPPLPQFAWSRSPTHNLAYFNPLKTYEPWRSEGGFTFGNASPTAARFDPVFGTATSTMNLTLDRAGNTSVASTTACSDASLGDPPSSTLSDHVFRVFQGMVIPAGTCIRALGTGGSNFNNRWNVPSAAVTVNVTGGNNAIPDNARLGIRYFPATFYLPAAAPLPASYGYSGAPLAGTAPDGSALLGYEIKPANFATPAQYNAMMQNFANWFSYYRKRHQALRAGMGEAFFTLSGMRVGGFTINSATTTSPNVTLNSIDVPANRTNLFTQFYRDWIQSGGTPNRTAVANIIRNYRRVGVTAPIQYACQKNFGMLFTDGFSNNPVSGDGITGVGNVDGGRGDPYQDGTSNTMADAVMGAYVNTVRPDLPQNKVTTPAACATATPDPRLDCNNDPHMNFYAVTLGARGLQFNPDAAPPQDPYTTAPTWPTTFPLRHPSAVDDIWHATINGRGELLNAKSSDELADKLRSVLTGIVNQTGSASSASVNSGSISSDTRLFQAKFDSRDWSGELVAFRINEDGSLGAEDWNAADELPDAATRQIITVNSATGGGVPFQWASLSPAQQTLLGINAVVGTARLNYLRGDQTNEAPAATGFRPRASRLGDIISSSPIFVRRPAFGYSDTLEAAKYSDFRTTHENRTPVVYAGANDGMLHAFNANTGSEILAFVPSAAYRNLATLSDTGYAHRFFVDGAPNMGDAFFSGSWHTVLVGGLNRGGQGIYALDITRPGTFGEGAASNIVMWEFTDADDADLGYTYSQPGIVRLKTGRWGVVFGNGYNNTETDGAVSSTGNAVLYIVDVRDGSIIRKLDTGVGTADDPTGLGRPNGLSTSASVDVNNDQIVDFIYAGDLFGNLWKFDVRSNDASDWKISFGTTAAPLPLFSARDPNVASRPQPITSRPEVIRGPRGVGMMVLFGTGKYLENEDKIVDTGDPDIQAHYALHDRNAHDSNGVQLAANRVTALGELVEQRILEEPTVTFDGETFKVRLTTNEPVPSGFKGWYMNLVSPDGYEGERQVSNTIVRNGRVIFTTLIPDSDPCGSGGSSWLMELSALTGGRLPETPFDLNNDGVFDENDFVEDASGNRVAVGGMQLGVGIATEPGVLMGEGAEYKYNAGTTGAVAVTRENPGPGATGRQSWRQIR